MTMFGKLCSLSLFAAILVGSPLFCSAANLRASSSFSSYEQDEQSITVSDSDLVGISSYLVVQVKGYEMGNLENISPEKQAIIDCAFHKAFDQVHGDRDGLYLSGQQIVATAREDDDDDGNDDTMEGTGLDTRFYKRRPRVFPTKPRKRPEYPPPRPPRGQYKVDHDKWNIYTKIDTSGRCNMCPDDDSMEVASRSVLLNSNQNDQNALDIKYDRDQRIASDFVMSEASVNAIADALRQNLIEDICDVKGDAEDTFEFVHDTDIFVLSQGEFEESVAAIAASREATVSTALLPFHFRKPSPSTGIATAAASTNNRLFRIDLSGVTCGPMDKTDLLDINSGLHDSINAMGFVDKGHIIDKIVGGKAQPRPGRRYVWKCYFEVYAKLDLGGIHRLNDAALDDIGDALCDNLIQFGGKKKFKNAIDCRLSPLTVSKYEEAIVNTKNNTGLPASEFLA